MTCQDAKYTFLKFVAKCNIYFLSLNAYILPLRVFNLNPAAVWH